MGSFIDYEGIFMISNYMQDKIMNWSRWCLMSQAKGRCRSLEHRYIAESDIGREIEATIFIDNLDAAKVESCISHPQFPKKYRRLIINQYIHRKQYQQTCRELGIRYNLHDNELIKAVNILDARLHKKALTLNPLKIILSVEDKRPAPGHGVNTHLFGELATA